MNNTLLLPLAFVVFFLAGIVLMIRGLRGRRVGYDPHCKKCRYNLTGLSTDQCPECGSTILAETVVVGMRQRRRAELVVGVLVLLIGGGGFGSIVTGQANRVNWYLYYPTGWLVRMATGDDLKALNELIRRTKDGTMSATQFAFVTDAALEKHGAEPASPNIRAWADLLAYLDAKGELSSEQQDQFFSRVAPVELVVRPRIRQEDSLVQMIRVTDYGSSVLHDRFETRLEDRLVDGRSDHWRDVEWPGVSFGWGKAYGWRSSWISSAIELEPGTHTLEWVFTQAVFPPDADPETTEPIWSREVRLTAPVEVVSIPASDPITISEYENLRASLSSTIRVVRVSRNSPNSGGDYLSAQFVLDQPAPVCLCFDVFATTAEGESFELGAMCWSRGQTGSAFASPLSTPRAQPHIPAEVVLILQPSREAASRTIDCFEIWDGVLLLGPTPVSGDEPRIRQAPPTDDQGESPVGQP